MTKNDGFVETGFVVGNAANDPIFVLSRKFADELVQVDGSRCNLYVPADISFKHLEVNGAPCLESNT